MAIRTYECQGCGGVEEIDVPMTAPAIFSKRQDCIACGGVQTFETVFQPTHVTFGMYTKRYTGQEAAVNGWGTYKTDYSGSDLVKGRAIEAAEERNGRAMKRPEKRS